MADAVRTRRAVEDREVVRDFAETTHRARSWSCERHTVASIEATRLGLDIRFVVTNLTGTSPRVIYESLYGAHGQAENRSSSTRRNSPLTGRPAGARWPTRSAWCCIRPPIG
jgi:hypothetical protein